MLGLDWAFGFATDFFHDAILTEQRLPDILILPKNHCDSAIHEFI